jgi:hypothetical protein
MGGSSMGGSSMGGSSMGGGSMGGGGAGGSPGCLTCFAAVQTCINGSCPPDSAICPASLATFQALKTCTCMFCSADCNQTCNNMGMNATTCATCIQQFAPTACGAFFQACILN